MKISKKKLDPSSLSPGDIEKIVAMGFSEENSKRALCSAQGDVQEAISLLLSTGGKMPEDDSEDVVSRRRGKGKGTKRATEQTRKGVFKHF